MKILVVGAGVSGVSFAISRKRSHPKDEITIIDRMGEPLKKILATGNGKCNIANTSKLEGKYSSSFATEIMRKNDYHVIANFLDSINIKTKEVGELVYPITESAVTVRNALLKALEKYHINILLNEEIDDYIVHDDYFEVFLKGGTYKFDKIVFSTGGKSQANLGSDGSVFALLKEHGYEISPLLPALCPIKIKENVKALDGVRVKAKVTIKNANKVIFKESGEVLFKKDGLSGIVMFNASRVIAHQSDRENIKIYIDPLENVDYEDLGIFLSFNNKEELLSSYLHPALKMYISKMDLEGTSLINKMKSIPFTFSDFYGFDFSQVTVGGVSVKNLNEKLGSNIENGVYFIGEVIDNDAPCGGYNLMWAIASALYVSDYM